MRQTKPIRRTELIKARINKHLNQNELAKLIGISQPGLSQIEKGVRNPTLEQIKLLVELLDINVSIL